MHNVRCHVQYESFCTLQYIDTMAHTMAGTIKGHDKMSLLNTLYPPVCAECDVAFIIFFFISVYPVTQLCLIGHSWPVQYNIT